MQRPLLVSRVQHPSTASPPAFSPSSAVGQMHTVLQAPSGLAAALYLACSPSHVLAALHPGYKQREAEGICLAKTVVTHVVAITVNTLHPSQ
jgi:hypothetical protein